jgi:serine acetyltransferase
MIHVARDLAPLGLKLFEERPGVRRHADFRIVFDVPGVLASSRDDVAVVRGGRPLTDLVAEAERAILRWLECRVERRFPDAVVGPNPIAARVLQFVARKNLPFRSLVSWVLNCDLGCPIRSPILMPYPYGIVIEPGARIGSRVTIMQQASLHGAPVIEDNVCIGPGARIAGEVRIGRGATVGANAVVTRDVPSHCTVVGANRILGVEPPSVAGQRLADHESVVNT